MTLGNFTRLLEEHLDTLDGITDVATAEAARPRLEGIARGMREILDAAGKPSGKLSVDEARIDARVAELTAPYEERLDGNLKRLRADPAVWAIVEGAMAGVLR
jgi:hypothetical protein